MTGEISYDLKMDEDMPFVEGTFRLPGGPWQVVIISKRPVSTAETVATTWESGVTGIYVRFPTEQKLDKPAVETILAQSYGVSDWVEVRGPDSMRLR